MDGSRIRSKNFTSKTLIVEKFDGRIRTTAAVELTLLKPVKNVPFCSKYLYVEYAKLFFCKN